jgi:nicotinamidase-related amidase
MTLLERFTARDAALLVVDVQERLLPAILDRDRLLANVLRLVHAAGILDIPASATEQYPRGLGPTVPELAKLFPDRPAKLSFHCCGAPGVVEWLAGTGARHVNLVGIEAHVCVAQTALELLRLGYRVQVPVDAVGSRHRLDAEVALRRLERAGAVVSTAEAVLFEWTEGADHPRFKEISAIVKERPAD